MNNLQGLRAQAAEACDRVRMQTVFGQIFKLTSTENCEVLALVYAVVLALTYRSS